MRLLCEMCGDEGEDVRVLQHSAIGPAAVSSSEPWRVGRVCDDCMTNKLMPTLRWLMGPTAWLGPPGNGVKPVELTSNAVYHTFESESETTHVLEDAETGPKHGWRVLCRASCGISAYSAPEDRLVRLESHGESVCSRCAAARPELFRGAEG